MLYTYKCSFFVCFTGKYYDSASDVYSTTLLQSFVDTIVFGKICIKSGLSLLRSAVLTRQVTLRRR